MITYFGSQISPNKVETAEGFLICRNVPIARIGPQMYLARELQLDGEPEREINVNRYEEDVFDKRTIASFEGKPVTDTHPDEAVSPRNYSDLAKGHAQNVRREGDFLVADLYINDADLIQEIQSGRKKEVSCGYMCNYEPDGENYKQTHIRGNHVAIVQSGRAGHDVAIKDAAAKAEERTQKMSKFSKAVLTAFGVAAKDANDEELKAMTDIASIALDADPSEPAEEKEAQDEEKAEPAEEKKAEDEMIEEAPKGDDLGSKLDKVIEMLGALMNKGAADEDPEDKDLEEDADPEEEEETEDEDPEKKSEVVEEETEDECGDVPIKDSIDFLKVIRPAIAGISNKKERAAVSKAIQKAVQSADVSAIFVATQAAAKDAAERSSKTSYEKACEAQMNAYSARNPHNKKEEN